MWADQGVKYAKIYQKIKKINISMVSMISHKVDERFSCAFFWFFHINITGTFAFFYRGVRFSRSIKLLMNQVQKLVGFSRFKLRFSKMFFQEILKGSNF